MCKRLPDEPLWAYFFRMIREEPQTVLTILGYVGMVALYFDGKAMLSETTNAYKQLSSEIIQMRHELKTEMHEANIRINTLENWHKYEDSKHTNK